jgi:hypothetical protein
MLPISSCVAKVSLCSETHGPRLLTVIFVFHPSRISQYRFSHCCRGKQPKETEERNKTQESRLKADKEFVSLACFHQIALPKLLTSLEDSVTKKA